VANCTLARSPILPGPCAQGSTPHSNNNPGVRSGVSRPQALLPSSSSPPHSFVGCLSTTVAVHHHTIFEVRSTLVRAFQSCRLLACTPHCPPGFTSACFIFLTARLTASPQGAGAGMTCLSAHHLRNAANPNYHSPACLPPICLRARNKPPGGENLTTTPTHALRTSRAAAALPTGTDQGVHQMLTARVTLPMLLAHDAPASTAPRTRLGTATANTEGGAPRTTKAQAATHPRSLAVETPMLAQCIHPPIFQETESQ